MRRSHAVILFLFLLAAVLAPTATVDFVSWVFERIGLIFEAINRKFSDAR